MITCIVSYRKLEICIDGMNENTSKNKADDGKIFIYDVQDSIILSTGFRGNGALE